MILRIGYLLLISIAITACSGNSSDSNVGKEMPSGGGSEVKAEATVNDYAVVCGVLFKVKDFDVWEAEYNKHAQNTIIYLRSIDDPSIVVLFEGNNSHQEAINRINDVMGKAFTENSEVAGKPVTTYYDIRYFQPKEGGNNNFLALSFNVDDEANWQSISDARVEQLANYGLDPLGMGSNFGKPENIYLLLSVENLEQFRENNNSPREISNFLKTLNFPKNTGLSFWSRP